MGLLVEPTRGVDLTRTMALAELLARPREHAVVIASRDVEFLVRVADRILLVEGDHIVADAAPTALVERLPHRPVISQALPGLRAVRHQDLTLVPQQPAPAGGHP